VQYERIKYVDLQQPACTVNLAPHLKWMTSGRMASSYAKLNIALAVTFAKSVDHVSYGADGRIHQGEIYGSPTAVDVLHDGCVSLRRTEPRCTETNLATPW
jgi:hypothetical protein